MSDKTAFINEDYRNYLLKHAKSINESVSRLDFLEIEIKRLEQSISNKKHETTDIKRLGQSKKEYERIRNHIKFSLIHNKKEFDFDMALIMKEKISSREKERNENIKEKCLHLKTEEITDMEHMEIIEACVRCGKFVSTKSMKTPFDIENEFDKSILEEKQQEKGNKKWKFKQILKKLKTALRKH